MRFDLTINDTTITRVSVLNKGLASAPAGYGNAEGWFVYEWNAWRLDDEDQIRYYAAGELVHRQSDGIEQLAILVLQEYREVAHPEAAL